MTDNDIKKALECCLGDIPPCTTCKYDFGTNTVDECMGKLMQDALDLINRQQAEIEKLEFSNEHWNDWEVKCRAIKEFAERLSDRISDAIEESSNNPNGEHYFITDVYETIENLVAEMTESPTKIEHSSLCETDTYEVKE